MTKLPVRALVAAIAIVAAGPALALGDPNDPNWPCVQRKVPTITLGAAWSGPAFDPATVKWHEDEEVVILADYLAQRRIKLDDAKKAIADFAAKAGADRNDRLVLLFAALFEKLNDERGDVITGIGRFAKKQRDFADSVRATTAELDKFRNDPKTDPIEAQQRTDEVLTKTRIFEERQKALTFVCEVPVTIEQRLFALGKAIQAEIK
ncbi:hypothetical protein [Chthonobacter albigriseus]|uniref:hypothetical protein n=1 Tax=Chthonobacter albigriseus TaxID=1683161 RepID=UPI0015EF1273|nr:hypothetical protein [Chthonobacter albigriseus]